VGRIELHLDAEDVEALAEDVLGRMQEMLRAGDLVPRLLTVNQVAEIMQVSPSKVYDLVKATKGPLPAIRVGERGGIRIDPRVLNRWLEEHPYPRYDRSRLDDLLPPAQD